MSDDEEQKPDSPVKSRSDAEVEKIAEVCWQAAGIVGPAAPILDLVRACAEKFRASKSLRIIQVDDAELPDREAEAILVPPTIKVRRSVYEAAQRNEPRARMTIAHEFGHIILEHQGHARPRRIKEIERHAAFKPYEDAEHQAKVFAPAFLIPRSLIDGEISEKEIQLRFRVSAAAACIRRERIFGVRGKEPPGDVLAVIDAMKARFTSPSPIDHTQRELQYQTRLDSMWQQLEIWPGRNPETHRKARGFGVRRLDHLKPRSDYGWKEHHGEIRAYRDLESL